MTINDKIAHLIKDLGQNETSFAKEIGLSPTGVYHITGGRKSKPGSDFLQKVKDRYPDVDMNTLLTEDDNVEFFPKVKDGKMDFGAAPGKIPVLTQRAAANSIRGIQNSEPIEIKHFIELPKEIIGSGTLVAIQARGVSMSPVILDGSYVIVRMLEKHEWRDFKNGWIHLVYTETYGAQIKYLKRSERDASFLIMESENPESETVPIDASEILGLWEWKGNLNLKFHSVKNTLFERLDRLESALYNQIRNQPKQLE